MIVPVVYPTSYEAIVVGGGHAGCEAAWALAKRGHAVLLIVMEIDRIAQLSCNPSIGGVAKGHLAKEIDALGGLMARVADATAIQYRTLNASKGPAVRSSRLQCDTTLYRQEMMRRLSQVENLDIVQAEAQEFLIKDGKLCGVRVLGGVVYQAPVVILCAGTFLRGLCHIGEFQFDAGRAGDASSKKLSTNLIDLGVSLMRLKTGTPPRLSLRSLDLASFEVQHGDPKISRLSHFENGPMLEQRPCYMAYTDAKTHELIRNARERSPMFNGSIEGVGARYCPSIEDKVFRFADKDRHQIFIEPMGLYTDEVYPAGISSSLPYDVQLAFIRSIPGFSRAHVMRPAYAVEYDALQSGQISHDLSLRALPGVFVAGQINGTSGYEEAAAQGLMAGINASLFLRGEAPFVLRRDEAYIGVMIDDLVMRGVDEPYRMFTSRAEFRLSLREDNADLRLSAHGHRLGLLSDTDFRKVERKVAQMAELRAFIETHRAADLDRSKLSDEASAKIPNVGRLSKIIKMPGVDISLFALANDALAKYDDDVLRCFEIEAKFSGYIARETARIEAFVELESRKIPAQFDYNKVRGLSTEVLNKLKKNRPSNFAEAKRIPGMTPAAINAIWVAMRQ